MVCSLKSGFRELSWHTLLGGAVNLKNCRTKGVDEQEGALQVGADVEDVHHVDIELVQLDRDDGRLLAWLPFLLNNVFVIASLNWTHETGDVDSIVDDFGDKKELLLVVILKVEYDPKDDALPAISHGDLAIVGHTL